MQPTRLSPPIAPLATALLSIALLSAAATAQNPTLVGLSPEPGKTWPHPASPDGNPFPRDSTGTPAELAQRDRVVRLGKMLFWDEQVSIDNTTACATCHAIEAGGTDDRLGAVFMNPSNPNDPNNGNFGAFGVIRQAMNSQGQVEYGFTNPASSDIARQVTPVHTPTMIGAYLFTHQFWDVRVNSTFTAEDGTPFPPIPPSTVPAFSTNAALEGQAVAPPISSTEMGHQGILWSDGTIQGKLNGTRPLELVDPTTIPPDILFEATAGVTYARLFDAAFHGHPIFGGTVGVTRERFAMAIAHYERTLIPDDAPIDRGQMTSDQIAGMNLMKTRGACFACHSFSGNPTLAANGKLVNAFDSLFSDGVKTNQVHQINVTPGTPIRKTPTLRNLGLRKKFFSTGHGGNGINKIMVTNMDELITFYDNQPGGPPINLGFTGTLTAIERAQVRAFLEVALTDQRVAQGLPPFDHPQLASLRPEFAPFEINEYGSGTSGPSGTTPEIIANSLPLVPKPNAGVPGTSWFKVGVGNAPGNAFAALLFSRSAATGPVIFVGAPFFTAPGIVTNAQGIGTSFNPFPLTPSLLGTRVFTQWVVDDNGVRIMSNAAHFDVFQF